MEKNMNLPSGNRMTGKDASWIKPKFVPNTSLMARDDSGGPDYDPTTQEFGDGGDIVGAKSHLSASGGTSDKIEGSEVSDSPRTMEYDRESKRSHIGNISSSRSKREASE